MEMLYIWLILISFAGGFLQASIGFGYAAVVMVFFPMLLHSIPVASSVCAVLSMIASTFMFLQYRKSARPKYVLWPTIFFLIIMPFTTKWAAGASNLVLSVIFGAFLIALGLFYLFTADKIRIPYTRGAGIIVGALAGVFGGLFAVSAPPVALYCLSTLETKEEYIGTLQFFFLMTNAYSVLVRAYQGQITSQVLMWALVASGGVLLGVYLGQIIYKRANLSRIKRWVLIFIACTGVWTIVSNV